MDNKDLIVIYPRGLGYTLWYKEMMNLKGNMAHLMTMIFPNIIISLEVKWMKFSKTLTTQFLDMLNFMPILNVT